jgi:hypothetical protein
MKTMKNISLFLVAAALLISSCEKKGKKNIVPEDFKIGISDAISSPDFDKKGLQYDLLDDTVRGNELYQQLRNMIYVGEFSADIVNSSMLTIRELGIDQAMDFSFTSKDDGRKKDVVVRENVDFQNRTWQYGMMITDAGNKAFQLFWDLNPVEGIALLDIGEFNHQALLQRNSFIKIEYSEDDLFFDRQMLVYITNLDSLDRNYMNKLKMFVGQWGDLVYIRGNSNHPTAAIVDPNYVGGRSWCFVAKNHINLNIALAKVSMPPVDLNTISGIWSTFSMDKVLEEEIRTVYSDLPTVEQDAIVAVATAEAKSPGFFVGNAGFYTSGLDNIPLLPGFDNDFIDLSGLDPFIPNEVNIMDLTFTIDIN